MAGSIGVALRKAVAAGLSGHYADLGEFNGGNAPEREVEVSYGYNPASSATEQVYTGRSRAETPPAAMRTGRNFRAETGEFDLIVRVRYSGGNVEDADDRAFAIGEVAEEWLADRKGNELGVPGLLTLTTIGWESNYGNGDTSAETLLIYRVRWTARLT